MQATKTLVETYGYDGIDLDWEPLADSDHDAFTLLLADLRAEMPNTLITMPVAHGNYNIPTDRTYFAAIARQLNQVNVMTYGMAGTWPGWKSWHASPLHWNNDRSTPMAVDISVDGLLDAGVPAAKLGLGAGFFGLCYTAPVTGPVQALEGATMVGDHLMSYAHVMTDFYSPAARRWDDQAMVPYLSFSIANNC